MDDAELDAYISKRINELDLTPYDLIHGRIDMSHILTEGEYNQFDPYGNFAMPLKDIIRYWWNNIAGQDGVIDIVLDDILVEFKDRRLPKEEQDNPADLSDAFDDTFKEAV